MVRVIEEQKEKKLPNVLDLGTVKIVFGREDEQQDQQGDGQDTGEPGPGVQIGGVTPGPGGGQGGDEGEDKEEQKDSAGGGKDGEGDEEVKDDEKGSGEGEEGEEDKDTKDTKGKDQKGSGEGKEKQVGDPNLDDPDKNIFAEIKKPKEDDKPPPPHPPKPPKGPEGPDGKGPKGPVKPVRKPSADPKKEKEPEKPQEPEKIDPKKYGGEVKPQEKELPDEPPKVDDIAQVYADVNQTLSGGTVKPEELGSGGLGIALTDEVRAYPMGLLTNASASQVDDDGITSDPNLVAGLRPILEAFLKVTARKLDPSEMDPQDVARRGKPTLVARGVLTKQHIFDLDKLLLSADLSGSVDKPLASKLIKSYFDALQKAIRRSGKSSGRTIQMISLPYADNVAVISAVATLANISKVAYRSIFDRNVVSLVGNGTTAPIPLLSNLNKLIALAPAGVNKKSFTNPEIYVPFLMFSDFYWMSGLGEVVPALKRHMQNKIFIGVAVGVKVGVYGTLKEVLKYVPYSAILDVNVPRTVLVSDDLYKFMSDVGVSTEGVRYIPVSRAGEENE